MPGGARIDLAAEGVTDLKQMHQPYGIRLFVIDYPQLLHFTARRAKADVLPVNLLFAKQRNGPMGDNNLTF